LNKTGTDSEEINLNIWICFHIHCDILLLQLGLDLTKDGLIFLCAWSCYHLQSQISERKKAEDQIYIISEKYEYIRCMQT